MTTFFPFQKIEIISSNQNAKYKFWSRLLLSKERKKEKMFLLSGEKIITEFLSQSTLTDKYKIKAVLLPNNEELFHHFLSTFPTQEKNIFFRLEKALLDELDIIGTHYPLLVLEYPEVPEETLHLAPVGLELVCPIGDPNNLGALCRSALAFGIHKMILTKNASDPFHPKALKSSSGAILRLSLTKLNKDLTEISSADLSPYDVGLDLEGKNIKDFSWPKNCRLWLGEEGPGLKCLPKDQCLFIPTKDVESLNVTVAGSIALYDYQRQMKGLQ